MNRFKHAIKVLAAVAVALSTCAAAAADPPNIIFILADDK
jgi:hypothetical protein